MSKSRLLTAMVMALLCLTSVMAQDESEEEAYVLGYKPQPYGFVQLQGGVSSPLPFADSFCSGIKPTASIGVGAIISPHVGARIHVNAWESRSVINLNPLEGSSNFNYINTDIDLLVNVTNFFRKKSNYLFNLYVVGGAGWKHFWNTNTCSESIANSYQLPADMQDQSASNENSKIDGVNIRAGLLFDFNIHKHWNIGLEVDINDNRFGTTKPVPVDGLLTAQLSLTYKFGHKKVSRPAPEPIAPVTPKPREETVVASTATAKAAVQDEAIKETIFFEIRGVDTADNYQEVVGRVAQWCKKYPNKTINVDGYADKDTGTEQINNEYAELRATKFAEALQAQGISASQMIIRHHGHSVQPFAENDKNRCVIIVGK